MVVLDQLCIAGPRNAAGPGGCYQPFVSQLYIHKCLSVLQLLPDVLLVYMAKMHKPYVRHISLGTGGSQGVGALLACAAPISVLHTLCCSMALAARHEAAVCVRYTK